MGKRPGSELEIARVIRDKDQLLQKVGLIEIAMIRNTEPFVRVVGGNVAAPDVSTGVAFDDRLCPVIIKLLFADLLDAGDADDDVLRLLVLGEWIAVVGVVEDETLP